ncbi:MAG: DUF3267 domain-containing protein [Bacillus sp. (in: firmicutes)]
MKSTMQCWKSINLNKQYGFHKILILSCMTMVISFMVIYPFTSFHFDSVPLQDDKMLPFISLLLLLFPIHKLLHLIPLLFFMAKLQVRILPGFSIMVKEPISKHLYTAALLTPFIVVTASICLITMKYPSYSHYSAILLSYHTGICLSDFLKLKNTFYSPYKSFIEETDEGYEILVADQN